MKTKIFISVRGGCITAVCCSDSKADVTIIDWDNDGDQDSQDIDELNEKQREQLITEGKLHCLPF